MSITAGERDELTVLADELLTKGDTRGRGVMLLLMLEEIEVEARPEGVLMVGTKATMAVPEQLDALRSFFPDALLIHAPMGLEMALATADEDQLRGMGWMKAGQVPTGAEHAQIVPRGQLFAGEAVPLIMHTLECEYPVTYPKGDRWHCMCGAWTGSQADAMAALHGYVEPVTRDTPMTTKV